LKLDIFLIGAFGSGNLGDDVLLRVVIEQLKNHTTMNRVGILCRPASYLKRIVGDAVLISRGEACDIEAQACIYAGGTQFFKFAAPTKLLRRIQLLVSHPRYVIKKLLGKTGQKIESQTHAMVGIGFGPFEGSDAYPLSVSDKIGKCDLVAVRDKWSHEFALANGHDHVTLAADMAFATLFRNEIAAHISKQKPADSHKTSANLNPKTIQRGVAGKRIAFILRDWKLGGGHDAHIEQSAEVAKQLSKQGALIEFIIFSRDPGLDRNKLGSIGTVVQWDPNQSEQSFVASLRHYDLIATSRFHGAVFGFLLDRPVIGICVDPKISLFMNQIEHPKMKWTAPYDTKGMLTLIDQHFSDSTDADFTERNSQIREQLTVRADNMLDQLSQLLAAKMAGYPE
jgi:polysaccharide pyruvyl transferase WcaK-like protein